MSKAPSLGLTGIKGFLVFPSGFNDITLSYIWGGGSLPWVWWLQQSICDFILEEGGFSQVFLIKGLSVSWVWCEEETEEKENNGSHLDMIQRGARQRQSHAPWEWHLRERAEWVTNGERVAAVRRGLLWRGLIGRWRWAATLQKAGGKGWHASWVSEHCSENSSGLLSVAGAPTTSERKGTWCQQSTFHHSQSLAGIQL